MLDLDALRKQIAENREIDEVKEKLEKHGGMTKPMIQLQMAYDLCREFGKYHGWDAMTRLIDFMGYELGLYTLPLDRQEQPEIWKKLRALVDFKSLADYEDNLGKLLTATETNNKAMGQYLTPSNIATFMTEMVMSTKKMKPFDSVCDPCCGFGVFLLKAMHKGPDGIELYGVDLDRRACRATMVQLEINRRYNHRDVEYYIVNGDSLLNDFSWADANKW